MNNDQTSGMGVSHLSQLPITTTFGFLLIAVLVLLLILRLVFADVNVGGRAGLK